MSTIDEYYGGEPDYLYQTLNSFKVAGFTMHYKMLPKIKNAEMLVEYLGAALVSCFGAAIAIAAPIIIVAFGLAIVAWIGVYIYLRVARATRENANIEYLCNLHRLPHIVVCDQIRDVGNIIASISDADVYHIEYDMTNLSHIREYAFYNISSRYSPASIVIVPKNENDLVLYELLKKN